MNWQEFEQLMSEAAAKISARPAAIVAIVRGGLIPGRVLSTLLGVRTMYALTVEKFEEKRFIRTSINAELDGLEVLLVEDALESGESLLVAQEYLESLGATVESFALYTTGNTKVIPTYTLGVVSKIPEFPWENAAGEQKQ